MAELAYALVLGTSTARYGGSSPSGCTDYSRKAGDEQHRDTNVQHARVAEWHTQRSQKPCRKGVSSTLTTGTPSR